MNEIPNPQWLFFENIEDAKAAQKEMAKKVSLEDSFNNPIALIGGMDVSNTPFDPKQMIFGAMVVCSYPVLTILQKTTQANEQDFPYVPGLLGFREVPTISNCSEELF